MRRLNFRREDGVAMTEFALILPDLHGHRRRAPRLRPRLLLLDRGEPRRERDGALGGRRSQPVRPDHAAAACTRTARRPSSARRQGQRPFVSSATGATLNLGDPITVTVAEAVHVRPDPQASARSRSGPRRRCASRIPERRDARRRYSDASPVMSVLVTRPRRARPGDRPRRRDDPGASCCWPRWSSTSATGTRTSASSRTAPTPQPSPRASRTGRTGRPAFRPPTRRSRRVPHRRSRTQPGSIPAIRIQATTPATSFLLRRSRTRRSRTKPKSTWRSTPRATTTTPTTPTTTTAAREPRSETRATTTRNPPRRRTTSRRAADSGRTSR